MPKHVVQSPEWAEFKIKYGTPAIESGGVIYTKHKIPFTSSYFAYCPKIVPEDVEFVALKKSLNEQDCVSINFDVPNVILGSDQEKASLAVFNKLDCVKSPRNQFAIASIVMDLTKSEDDLLANMHPKHRYNTLYSQKKGAYVKKAENDADFNDFFKLFEDTAKRQKYYIRPYDYYKTLWDMFKPRGMSEILTAYYNNQPLASWMFLKYEDVLYYPYGGSSEEIKNIHASNLVAWEGIKLGKQLDCKVFDMWGASEDINDTSDPWWGFTNFKLKFGGTYVKYLDSYDLVINEPVYRMFNLANNVRWKLLKALA